MKWRGVLSSAVATLGLVAVPLSASAAPLTGTISIASNPGGGAIITPTDLTWTPSPGVCTMPGGCGTFNVGTPTTGDFVPLIGFTDGQARNLTTADQPSGVGAPPPAPGGLPASGFNTLNPNPLQPEGEVLAGFLTFAGSALPNAVFDLSYVDPGAFGVAQCGLAPAPGQTCTLPGTPFMFTNTGGNNSTVSFTVEGFVRNTLTPLDGLSTFTGTYTTQFTVPYQLLLIELESLAPNALYAGSPGCSVQSYGTCGSIITTYSGTFTGTAISTVPEPATLLTFGLGSAALTRIRRRKKA